MREIIQKDNCCGCSACYNVCPASAISMDTDREGFLYPVINQNCIDCKKCILVCPANNSNLETPKKQYGFVVQNKNETVLKESTSGGAFTAIAEYVIENDGIVFGAAYNRNLIVKHVGVDTIEELGKFRNSKYVQSEIGKSFCQAKVELDKGRIVCFSGTPCQIEGLKSFLGKEYPKLITVDVVCRAVPSPLVYQKYIEYKQNVLQEKIKNIRFRDKFFGYEYSTLAILGENEKILYRNGIDTDEYLRAFFSNICDRPSCYNCKFKKRYRVSDFTLWDCFEGNYSSLDTAKGITKMLIHNEKGYNFFLEFNNKIKYQAVESDMLVKETKEMFQSIPINAKRKDFFRDANSISSEELFKKYFPITFVVRFEKTMRLIGIRFGVYKIIRKIYKMLFGERKR